DTRVVLLEAREKKVAFLERAIRELAISNVTAISARLEEYGRSWRSVPFDAVSIRAVGGLPKVLHSASRAGNPGAHWVYFVGRRDRTEVLLKTLDAARFSPQVRSGLFGGILMIGHLPVPA
ncbi:MAG TPA: RsmG family class I SAM-dependent methyltransferase, partial [Candidatus Eisenbacteria bacterium]